jgi:hypothetical protein
VEIRIRVPRVPAGAVSNLLGLLGLVAMVVAVGGLTGNVWWAVLTGGAFAVGLAVLAQVGAEAGVQAAAAPSVVVAAGNEPAAARPTPVAKAS